MNTTAVAALTTLSLGLLGCLWLLTQGRRSGRITAFVIMSVVACLSLVFYSIGRGGMAALDAALLMGVLAPMGTLLITDRKRSPGGSTALRNRRAR